ncbi:hypothetical protein [Serratia marcescens]|uniref:hypothetical protein n=1 Tax=Serratia marcescens TaxID=615 RepID=UPI001F14A9D0|nr:hypothetical protein [Serratia marcescens]MDP8728370.1 hypothetical protein [Serratia marcescens]
MIHIVENFKLNTQNSSFIEFKGGSGHLKIEMPSIQYVSSNPQQPQGFFFPEVLVNGVKSVGGYFKVDGPVTIEFRIPQNQWAPVPDGEYGLPDFGILYVPCEESHFVY